MRIFVTGADRFCRLRVVNELIRAGHAVTALARSEERAKALRAKGVSPHLGNIDDLESLRSAAAAADGVIHLAFMHGLTQIRSRSGWASCSADCQAASFRASWQWQPKLTGRLSRPLGPP